MPNYVDELDCVLAEQFINPDTFGEQVAFTPDGGGSRQISAAITEKESLVDSETGIAKSAEIAVYVKRHPVLGIDRPQLRDSIVRCPAADPESPRPWSWTGIIDDATPGTLSLIYRREIVKRVGGQTTRPGK